MVFPITGGTQSTGLYEVENSLRFNDDDSPYLTERPASGNRKTFTFSTWFKRGNLKSSGENFLFGGSSDGSSDTTEFKLQNDKLTFIIFDGSSNTSYIRTNAVLRDPAAWYHVVFRIDLTQATNTDRIRLYINGVLQTSLDQTTYDGQNNDSFMSLNNGYHRIGADPRTAANFFDGYMAETYYIDGQSYDPTYFGEFNDDGVWVPVEKNKGAGGTITFGTNGFYMQFQQTGTSANSSGMGADTSGQDNHFTPTNLAAIDVTEDTPTNNFATFNSIFQNNNTYFSGPATLREGNTGATGVNTEGNVSTIGLTQGKWYWEVKIVNRVSNDLNINIINIGDNTGTLAASVQWQSQDDLYVNGSKTADLNSFTDDDIIGVALDLDSSTPNVKFYKNGTVENSGNAIDFAASDRDNGVIFASIGIENTSDNVLINFGNPAFSISSGNTDGKYGNFEYAPPSGYYALCTKRLAEFG